MKKIFLLLLILTNILFPLPQKKTLAVSIFPIYDIAKNVVGDKMNIFFIVPAGANPHTFEPLPSIIERLNKSDAFLGVDEHLDGWVDKVISQNNKKFFLINEKNGHKEGHSDDIHENPHIWLSLKNAKDITNKICDIVSKIDPTHKDTYSNNTKIYLAKLEKLDSSLLVKFSKLKSKKFIQWHPSWDYFAKDYGLNIIATLEDGHGDEPSLKDMSLIIKKAKSEKVKIVVLDLNVQSKAVNTLISEIKGSIVSLDAIGNNSKKDRDTYLKLMEYNSNVLFNALNR